MLLTLLIVWVVVIPMLAVAGGYVATQLRRRHLAQVTPLAFAPRRGSLQA